MDTGQALVVSMLAIALIGALIAFTIEAMREDHADSDEPALPLRWLNISSTDGIDPDQSWVAQIAHSLSHENIEFANLAAPGATAIQLAHLLAAGNEDTEVDLATVWVGSEDFLSGTQILEFEECLDSVLNWLSNRGATMLVGNLPDFTGELVAAKLADPIAVRPVFEQWNASIARLTIAHGGTVVDLRQGTDLARSSVRYLYTTYFDPNTDAQALVAQQFAEAMSESIGLKLSTARTS